MSKSNETKEVKGTEKGTPWGLRTSDVSESCSKELPSVLLSEGLSCN